jgi:hypothetical protein
MSASGRTEAFVFRREAQWIGAENRVGRKVWVLSQDLDPKSAYPALPHEASSRPIWVLTPTIPIITTNPCPGYPITLVFNAGPGARASRAAANCMAQLLFGMHGDRAHPNTRNIEDWGRKNQGCPVVTITAYPQPCRAGCVPNLIFCRSDIERRRGVRL